MQNSFGLVLLILFGGGGLISILAVINLLFPLPVEATRAALEASLGRSLLIGLVNFIFVGLLDLLLLWLGQMAGRVAGGILVILGGAITVALGTLVILGLAGLTRLIGERIGAASSPLMTHLRGSLLIVLAGLTPFLGWWVFTPLVLWTGLGAAIQTLLGRRKKLV
jgi:hypothetical protein